MDPPTLPRALASVAMQDYPAIEYIVMDGGSSDGTLDILRRYEINVPPRALELLQSGEGETLKPGDPRLPTIETRFVATPQLALEAAANVARSAGYAPYILGDAIEGEARDVAKTMAGIALQVARRGQPVTPPCVLLSGGETTVTIRPTDPRGGRGGRNSEALLGCAVALDGAAGIWALMGDTDGIDGSEDNAGALAAPDTLARARAAGLDPRAVLERHDSYGLFQALGDLLQTGPTLTNVNDFRAVLVG